MSTASPTHEAPRGDVWLLGALIIYGGVNVVGYLLCITRIVHPPWAVLEFFTLPWPCFRILAVCFVQVASDKRPFTWLAFAGSIAAMLLAAYVNWSILESAAASV